MKKRLLSLLLVGVMASGLLAGCGDKANESTGESKETAGKAEESVSSKVDESSEESSQYPEYLNLDGYYPIVDKDEEITLKIAVLRTSGTETIPMEDLWFVKHMAENLNINVEWDEWTMDNQGERRNLMLMGNDLPDMMLNCGLGKGEANTYGVDNEMFLPVSDWVSEELTPNLYELLEDPSIYEHSAAKNGKVYSVSQRVLERIGGTYSVPLYRTFIDSKFLDAVGLEEAPDTLDGFIDFLRAVKDLDPETMGLEEILPYVPRYTAGLTERYLSTAFGWATKWNIKGWLWDVTEQKVVVPYLQEKYLDYVRVLNTLYTEGLIYEDMYTADLTETRADMLNAAVLDDDAAFVTRADWKDFVPARPLKSEYNNGTAVASTQKPIANGAVYISANTEYPELCVRFMDYLYSMEGSTYFVYGPDAKADDEIKLGMKGFTVDGSTGTITLPEIPEGEILDNWVHSNICPTMSVVADPKYYMNYYAGVEEINYQLNLEDANDHHNNQLNDMLKGGQKLTAVMTDPYLTEEQNASYGDLITLVKDYVSAEEAKFVTGERPIDELDDFHQEIMDMGGAELQELIDEIFADFEYVPYDYKYFHD